MQIFQKWYDMLKTWCIILGNKVFLYIHLYRDEGEVSQIVTLYSCIMILKSDRKEVIELVIANLFGRLVEAYISAYNSRNSLQRKPGQRDWTGMTAIDQAKT